MSERAFMRFLAAAFIGTAVAVVAGWANAEQRCKFIDDKGTTIIVCPKEARQ